MIYITGDTHGRFQHVIDFCKNNDTSKDDILIILGDAGINFLSQDSYTTIYLKKTLQELPITLFCIHGNHEERPSHIPTYQLTDFAGGQVWVEEEYPNLLFAKDGCIYNLEDDTATYKTLVVGGAYSIDKDIRIIRGIPWWHDEQPSDDIKKFTATQLHRHDYAVDLVLSHTCPYAYEPVEWFFSGINQKKVDKSTELWLESVYNKLDKTRLKKWCCGHFHGEKQEGPMVFLFNSIFPLESLIVNGLQ